MNNVHLTHSTKSHLLESLQPDSAEGKITEYQNSIVSVINLAVMGSSDSDELIAKLREGQEAFADAIRIVQAELKLEVTGKIHLDSRKAK